MSAGGGSGTERVWTYDDYRALPEDGIRYEVIDGELATTPSPTTAHQSASKRLLGALLVQVENAGRGAVFHAPIDVILSPTRVLVPDLVVLLKEREGLVSERGIEGPPDVVIEILSPRTRAIDTGRKRELYASAGVREYWMVDPDARTVEVLEPAGEGCRSRAVCRSGSGVDSGVLPLELAVEEVFRR